MGGEGRMQKVRAFSVEIWKLRDSLANSSDQLYMYSFFPVPEMALVYGFRASSAGGLDTISEVQCIVNCNSLGN